MSKNNIEAKELHLSIISEIEKVMDKKGIRKADLARLLGIGKSTVSKWFAGDKFLNIKNLAKIQIVLDVKFSFSLLPTK